MAKDKDKQKQVADKSENLPASSASTAWPLFDDLEGWLDDLNRYGFPSRWLGHGWPDPKWPHGGRIPRVDLIDREGEVCVRAELPGVSKDDLSVTLHDNILTIRTSTEKEAHEEKGHYHRRELVRSRFQRSLPLPAPVDPDQASSTFKDGILELILPKLPGYQPKKIKVE